MTPQLTSPESAWPEARQTALPLRGCVEEKLQSFLEPKRRATSSEDADQTIPVDRSGHHARKK
jgi:hypothetical protein